MTLFKTILILSFAVVFGLLVWKIFVLLLPRLTFGTTILLLACLSFVLFFCFGGLSFYVDNTLHNRQQLFEKSLLAGYVLEPVFFYFSRPDCLCGYAP
jgi:predicted neutral ceramidase superfamily lipid hydrolase